MSNATNINNANLIKGKTIYSKNINIIKTVWLINYTSGRYVDDSVGQKLWGYHGFLKADAAPMTTAKTIPRPAPTEAPTAAAVKDLVWESSVIATARSRANSNRSLSLASSFRAKGKAKREINCLELSTNNLRKKYKRKQKVHKHRNDKYPVHFTLILYMMKTPELRP